MRRWIVILASVVLAVACTTPAASTRSSTASPAPSAAAAIDPTPSAPATPAQSLDPLAPTVIPGLASVDAIDGTVVLGGTADDEAVLYNLADGTTTLLGIRLTPFPGDLGGGVAVGALAGSDTEAGSAFVYDIATGTLLRPTSRTGWASAGSRPMGVWSSARGRSRTARCRPRGSTTPTRAARRPRSSKGVPAATSPASAART